ncbi:MAG: aldolase/citrate lyase family protein [Bdellovibrionia bacterium]
MFDTRKKLKNKLRERKRTFAAWTSIGDAQITEAFAQMDVDFIGIDIEHGTISFEQCQRIIAASQAYGTCCLPRIDSHSMPMIKRLLDSGADGVIVPMVQTVEEVEKLIEWTKYPPKGKRSFGINRAQRYGWDFDTYTQQWNETSSLVLQIESIAGVENIERIMAFDEVDAVMVGPYDLSGSLGIPGQIDHPRVQEAAAHVISTAKAKGRGCGTQIVEPTPEAIETAFSRGYTFNVLSSDIFLLWKWGENIKQMIRNARPKDL